MAVKIGDKVYRNEQEQVRKNMEDIEVLKSKIKDVFKTSATLTTSSVSVALVDTNVTDEEEGWLMSEDGLLFAITGNDGTNLLISYYADLKGPQGEDGAAVNIDDSITSLTKVWSSSKTNNEISGLINDIITSNFNTWSSDQQTKLLSSGIAWTTVDKDGDDQISLDDIYIGNRTASESTSIIKVPMLKVSDIIVYVDSDLKAKTLYRVASIFFGIATVAKVCDIGGGSQLYEHNIKIASGTNDENYHFNITIVNADSTPFNYTTFTKWFEDKMTRGQHFKECSGCCHVYSTNYAINGIALQTGTRYDLFNMSCYNIANGNWSDSTQMQLLESSTKWAMEDKVIEIE